MLDPAVVQTNSSTNGSLNPITLGPTAVPPNLLISQTALAPLNQTNIATETSYNFLPPAFQIPARASNTVHDLSMSPLQPSLNTLANNVLTSNLTNMNVSCSPLLNNPISLGSTIGTSVPVTPIVMNNLSGNHVPQSPINTLNTLASNITSPPVGSISLSPSNIPISPVNIGSIPSSVPITRAVSPPIVGPTLPGSGLVGTNLLSPTLSTNVQPPSTSTVGIITNSTISPPLPNSTATNANHPLIPGGTAPPIHSIPNSGFIGLTGTFAPTTISTVQASTVLSSNTIYPANLNSVNTNIHTPVLCPSPFSIPIGTAGTAGPTLQPTVVSTNVQPISSVPPTLSLPLPSTNIQTPTLLSTTPSTLPHPILPTSKVFPSTPINSLPSTTIQSVPSTAVPSVPILPSTTTMTLQAVNLDLPSAQLTSLQPQTNVSGPLPNLPNPVTQTTTQPKKPLTNILSPTTTSPTTTSTSTSSPLLTTVQNSPTNSPFQPLEVMKNPLDE
eukprot:TRINITY_DN3983_c0_g1_i1.p1 TRINITY_DN3983_c0_g1~~TRINITY_DN3983_c0_g1_i1.p1  ORF type:complete len:565 (-),score=96.78 TRINITY_DN3983_c0_g1_i1:57-1556(-)